jgi:hypothetical protein
MLELHLAAPLLLLPLISLKLHLTLSFKNTHALTLAKEEDNDFAMKPSSLGTRWLHYVLPSPPLFITEYTTYL